MGIGDDAVERGEVRDEKGGLTFDHSGWCFFTAHSAAMIFMNS
jgi:hypothetical protein